MAVAGLTSRFIHSVAHALSKCFFFMQTLMDKEKRAAYDALAGFAGGAVNPFVDAAHERDHVRTSTYLACCVH